MCTSASKNLQAAVACRRHTEQHADAPPTAAVKIYTCTLAISSGHDNVTICFEVLLLT